MGNLDAQTVEGFGDEWQRFDQAQLAPEELQRLFDHYFSVFPWNALPEKAVGFDLGCGSGRWAKLVAPRVGRLVCVDASEGALAVAKRNLAGLASCELVRASVDDLPMQDGSMDFGYSLGVLHHVPDTQAGISACVAKLKPGAPFLVYLYYALDNRPAWFRMIWRASDVGRRAISKLPQRARFLVSEAIAATVYFPLARSALLLEKAGMDVSGLPLAPYRTSSFYSMRTDALDRFGTRLEQRFTKVEVETMMRRAGLEGITFAPFPYWCAVGYKKAR